MNFEGVKDKSLFVVKAAIGFGVFYMILGDALIDSTAGYSSADEMFEFGNYEGGMNALSRESMEVATKYHELYYSTAESGIENLDSTYENYIEAANEVQNKVNSIEADSGGGSSAARIELNNLELERQEALRAFNEAYERVVSQ